MKFYNTLILVIITMVSLTATVQAQYDDGTVIYSESSNSNLVSILNNYEVVDFDGDETLDILVVMDSTASSPNQLAWYKGDFDGNFTFQTNISELGSDYRNNEIFYADMNGDEMKDIVFQNDHSAYTIFINDGNGNISSQINNEITIGEFDGIELKELADIDQDGDLDAIIWLKLEGDDWWQYNDVNLGHCLIGYNDGDGACSVYNYLDNDNPEAFLNIESGDFDGDGYLDLIASGYTEIWSNGGEGPLSYEVPFLRIYKNTSSGFAPKEELALPEINNFKPAFTIIKSGDLDNDGNDELLAEYAIRDSCQSDLHLHGCAYFYQFHVLDYNLQNEEFVSIKEYSSWLHSYPVKASFWKFNEIYDEAFHQQYNDVNADNQLDILTVNVPQGKLQWHLGDGQGNFDETEIVNSNSLFSSIKPVLRTVDIDKDGDLDVLVLLNDPTSSELSLFKNLASTGTSLPNLKKDEMGIFPNPCSANSRLQFNLSKQLDLSKLTYSFYNLNGKKLEHGIYRDGEIFVPELNTGIYLFEMTDGKVKHCEKLMVR